MPLKNHHDVRLYASEQSSDRDRARFLVCAPARFLDCALFCCIVCALECAPARAPARVLDCAIECAPARTEDRSARYRAWAQHQGHHRADVHHLLVCGPALHHHLSSPHHTGNCHDDVSDLRQLLLQPLAGHEAAGSRAPCLRCRTHAKGLFQRAGPKDFADDNARTLRVERLCVSLLFVRLDTEGGCSARRCCLCLYVKTPFLNFFL